MGIHKRISRSIRNAAELNPEGFDASAHTAIATMFNWLSDPSETMLEIGQQACRDVDDKRCRRVWLAMLSQAQEEAGFVVPIYGGPQVENATPSASQLGPAGAEKAASPGWQEQDWRPAGTLWQQIAKKLGSRPM
jgi:hypothetical protein